VQLSVNLSRLELLVTGEQLGVRLSANRANFVKRTIHAILQATKNSSHRFVEDYYSL
jgi:hypothetical protein